MSSRILTYNVTSINAFMQDPNRILNKADGGTIAVFADNTLAFYAITSARLAKLLDLEIRLTRQTSNIITDTQFFEKTTIVPTSVQMGKFAMYSSWKPDEDFQRRAALWGIILTKPVKPEELAAFIAWWQEEKGRVFTHIQWQQKLARSIQIARTNQYFSRDINTFSQLDAKIPHGFRGSK